MAGEADDEGDDELIAIAGELYALPLDELIAERDARVKAVRADGRRALAKRIAGLRKPSVTAAAVNALVRARPDLVDAVVEAGAGVREAQTAGDAKAMREWSAVLRENVAAAVAAAGADEPLSATTAHDVGETLRSAGIDDGAAAAVRSGLLLVGIAATGLEPVDAAGLVAVPAAVAVDEDAAAPEVGDLDAARQRRAEREAERTATAERRAAEQAERDERLAQQRERKAAERQRAEDEARGAEDRRAEREQQRRDERESTRTRARRERAMTAARRALEKAERAQAEADAEVASAQAEIEAAEAAVAEAQRRLADARTRADEAVADAETAAEAVEDARAVVDQVDPA